MNPNENTTKGEVEYQRIKIKPRLKLHVKEVTKYAFYMKEQNN